MIQDDYVWVAWSSAFLVPWAALFIAFRQHRRAMLWASLFTAPFGLTEPLFVPEYWSPPSLFNLALRTGFDLESLIFCFGIGGVGAVLFNAISGRRLHPVSDGERHGSRHRYHLWFLVSPFLLFPPLYFLPWNPIYPSIVAMAVGSAATVLCRPDLKRAAVAGAGIFLAYYLVFLATLEMVVPGYIERVWNLDALTGWTILGLPIEELGFSVAFGAYWAGVYEHFTWHVGLRPATVGAASHG